MTIAFALVASAAAWQRCTALNLAAAAAAGIEHGSHAKKQHADAGSHDHTDHHAMHAHHAADDPAMPAADDHGCMKCCAMCTVANALLPAANATVNITVSVHVFAGDHETLTANTVAVDPGIPKRIV
jgi:hypothetical protein